MSAGSYLATTYTMTPAQHNALQRCLQFVSGATAGVLSTLLTYPFDLMRTQFVIQVCPFFYSLLYPDRVESSSIPPSDPSSSTLMRDTVSEASILASLHP